MRFKDYSKIQIHFIDNDIPTLLEKSFHNLEEFSVVDLGCGDGRLLASLNRKNLLKKAKNIVGIELSEIRCKRCKNNIKIADVICSDACSIPQKDQSFDLVICSQVIEHVPDDTNLLKEINRVLKNEHLLYISSVIKKPYGFYIYRNNGKIRLDETHVREYSSEKEFIDLLEKSCFKIVDIKISQIKFSLLDVLMRLAIRLSFIKIDNKDNIYIENRVMSKLRNVVRIPIIGYYRIDVLCEVENDKNCYNNKFF